MRKFLCLLCIAGVLSITVSSCTTMKKDCQGNRHVKLKNGIYI
ncbi:MAG TPA: hypothetical protein VM935_02110 [Chitinophagaceae bacterium]|nr:hypothetical protein [Chitinophagaceae bacterium]